MDPIEHITAEQIAEMGVVAAPDRLVGNAEENKKIFDRLVRELVAVVVNQIIDNVNIMANAETQRETAEEERNTGEDARVAAEKARVQAEEGRVTAESERAAAEQTRQTDEEGRKTAETKRVFAESTRQTNEQQRQSQESTRQANEETRQSQESTRQTNEQTRQTQEQARATAEAQRAAAEATRRNTFATELSQAQTARSAAEAAAKAADEDAQYVEETKDLSKSWAVGGTGTREGEDTNNAMYWSERAKNYAGGGVNSFNGRNGAVVPKTGDYTAEQVGADPKGTADAKVSEHNTSEASHQDLRLAISDHLTDKNNPHNVTAEQVGAIAAGAVGNVHVWQRVQTYADPVPEVPAGYTLGEVEENVAVTGISSSQVGLYVGDSISVDSDGNVTINNEKYYFNDPSAATNGWYGPSYLTLLAGKFCRVENSTRYTTLVSGVFYVPVGTTLVNPNNSTLTIPSLQRVTGHPYQPAIPAGTYVDYLTSTDENAYPDNVSDAQDAHYVLGPAVTGNFKLSANYNSSSIVHALSITVDDDGNISLVNGVEVPASKYDDTLVNALKGRFVTVDSTDIYSAFENGATIYIPNDASIDRTSGLTISKYQPVTGYPAIPANTVITYLGQLGEPGARIEVGSYVGTGTYGSSNPNSLTASFPIKIAIIGNYKSGSTDVSATAIFLPMGCATTFNKHGYFFSDYDSAMQDQYKYSKISKDGKTLYWYESRYAKEQLNVAARTYFYVLIG